MFEVKDPPHQHTNADNMPPKLKHFFVFLVANEGQWCKYHAYVNKQSGWQRAMTANRKYGALGYQFTSRTEDGKAVVYGRKILTGIEALHRTT